MQRHDKNGWGYWFFLQKYRFTTGKDKTFGWTASMLSETMLLILMLKEWGVDVMKKPWILIGIALCVFTFFWSLGVFYMKKNWDKIENIVQQERNPFVDEMHKKIVEGEDGRRKA